MNIAGLGLHLKTTKSRAQPCVTNHNLGNKSRARKKKKCALPVKSARMAQPKRAPHQKKVRARRPKSHAHARKIARTSADGERRGFRGRAHSRKKWLFFQKMGQPLKRCSRIDQKMMYWETFFTFLTQNAPTCKLWQKSKHFLIFWKHRLKFEKRAKISQKEPNWIGVPILMLETCPFCSRHRFDCYDQPQGISEVTLIPYWQPDGQFWAVPWHCSTLSVL